jgi:hypothetical protein
MPATQTSILSFIQLKDEQVLGKRQLMVYKFINFHPNSSDREISQGCQLPINCVTGRRNELVRSGFVKQEGIKFDMETNRFVSSWIIV